jgi:hypothetical protein
MTYLDIDETYEVLSFSSQNFKGDNSEDFYFDRGVSQIIENLEKFHEEFMEKKNNIEELFLMKGNLNNTNFVREEEISKKVTDHSEGNKKIFMCPYDNCGNSYSLQRVLQSHLKKHTEENIHKCVFLNCAKSYKSKENLNLHVKNKHLGVKPYKCSFCDSQFTHRNGS